MLELALVALLLCLTLVTWSILYARRRAGQPWVPYEPRRLVPWGLLDVFLALGLLVVLTSVALAALGIEATDQLDEARLPTDVDLQAASVLAQALVSLAVVAFSLSAIRLRYRAASTDLGWSVAKIGSDIRLGVVAFLALAPPVYALQICLVQRFESKHPLIELIRQNPQPQLIAVCIASAVLVAPVIEEYLFRGLLQGWLERLADGRDNSLDVVLGGPARQPTSASTEVLNQAAKLIPPPVCHANLANSCPATANLADDKWGKPRDNVVEGTPVAYWPIAISAFAFAILHLSHGPDWIPLLFLAFGLGYLYRQTHRLLPAIVVHFLLNACSMAMFLVEVFFGSSSG